MHYSRFFKYDQQSKEETANFLSKIFFCWLWPFIKCNCKMKLGHKDLCKCSSADKSTVLGDALEREWKDEVTRANNSKTAPSLMRTLRRQFVNSYQFPVLMLLQSVIPIILPLLQIEYIKLYEGDQTFLIKNRWFLATLIVFLTFLNSLLVQHCTLYYQRVGMRCRTAISSLLYRKLLKLNQKSLKQISLGKLITLFSNDVVRFDRVATRMHYIWITPIQIVVCFILMYNNMGLASLTGLFIVITPILLLQIYLGHILKKNRLITAQKSEKRIKLIADVIEKIQIIKTHAWEELYEKLVKTARKDELGIITQSSYIKGVCISFMLFTERLASLVTTLTMFAIGQTLRADIVFGIMQLFSFLEFTICYLLQGALFSYNEVKASIERIENFLKLDENNTVINENFWINKAHLEQQTTEQGYILLEHINASWIPPENFFTNLNIEIKPGSLCCIVGPPYAGKQSFMKLLIGELKPNCGTCVVNGKIAYCLEKPWLFNASIRNNIIFGEDYNEERYKKIMEKCGLSKLVDSSQDETQDTTKSSEDWIHLSQIQKILINLARLVYMDADIFLFDDILSSLDVNAKNNIFQNLISDYLSNKTRILVTNDVKILREADLILYFNKGQLTQFHSDNIEKELDGLKISNIRKKSTTQITVNSDFLGSSDFALEFGTFTRLTKQTKDKEDEEEELIKSKKIKQKTKFSNTHWNYWNWQRITEILFLVILSILAQLSCNLCDWILAVWYNMLNLSDTLHVCQFAFRVNNNSDDAIKDDIDFTVNTIFGEIISSQNRWITVYIGLTVLSIFLLVMRSFFFCHFFINTCMFLHKNLFRRILKAPMEFFYNQQSGKILNLFAKDMEIADEVLPCDIIELTQISLILIGIFLTVDVVILWIIIAEVVLIILFGFCMFLYVSNTRNLKRLERKIKAPAFSQVYASMKGLLTIQLIDRQKLLIEDFENLLDQHSGAWFLLIATNKAFGFYMGALGTIFLAIVTYQFFLYDLGTTAGGYVGLVLGQAMIFTTMLQRGLSKGAKVATNWISVEEIIRQYKLTESLVVSYNHQSLVDEDKKNPILNSGNIVFDNVSLSYKENVALKKISFEIHSGEKIGIVGPKGAGKSSLVATLLRLWNFEGTVKIDNYDLKAIDLDYLRSSVLIIEQNPTLHETESLGFNLDPTDKHKNEDLVQALNSVGLAYLKDSMEKKIETSTLTLGEKQRICLARTILEDENKNKILIFNRATSKLDSANEAIILNVIKKNFKNSTVIYITNNLGLLRTLNKILELKNGQILNFNSPEILLENASSYFSQMVNMANEENKILKKLFEKNIKPDNYTSN